MRDLIVFAVVGWALFKAFPHPHLGVYLWTWISLMNPHRLTWGPAFGFPFAAVVGGATIISMFLSRERGRMVWTRETVLILIFLLWTGVTTAFAFNADLAVAYMTQWFKIQIFVLLTIYLITDREKLNGLIWVTALSLGFYGIKGGIFTALGGGTSHVLGPEGSFIAENNALGLALIMTVPLFAYLYFQETRRWWRYGLGAAIFLCGLSIVGSQSRGALLGVVAMSAFLWLKSRRKFAIGGMLIFATMAVLLIMPESWWERMETIKTYDQDLSALGRINAWWTAWNVALSNVMGGGFRMFTAETFALYAPNPHVVFDAHSIYFQVLGEHGFVGLFLFVAIGAFTWLRCSQIIRKCKKIPDWKWAADLAGMIQVSLIGYAVSGAFLSLAYFDLYWHLVAIAIIVWGLSRKAGAA